MALFQHLFPSVALLALFSWASAYAHLHPPSQHGLSINDVPWHRREHWMRIANGATYADGEPCPQAPFGSAIVNTTSDELVCVAANAVGRTGDPTMHGEMTAIRACHEVLSKRGLSPPEILRAWRDFSLYTNGEPCPMCMSAIRWAGFKEVVFGTSIETIAKGGRNQIYIPSSDILAKSYSMGHMTLMLGGILTNETDPFFAHQFNESAPCPTGCQRKDTPGKRVGSCQPKPEWREIVQRREPEGLLDSGKAYREPSPVNTFWPWQRSS